jgi:Nucleotidyl transferase AbiEii toxin, Type IV TA system
VFADGGRLHDRVTLGHRTCAHPDDLAADKVLALWGRARPRDFFDVAALINRYGSERLLELAETKDSGFTAETFIDASALLHDSAMQTGQKAGSIVTTPNDSAQNSTPGATNSNLTRNGKQNPLRSTKRCRVSLAGFSFMTRVSAISTSQSWPVNLPTTSKWKQSTINCPVDTCGHELRDSWNQPWTQLQDTVASVDTDDPPKGQVEPQRRHSG